jgi:hypothetical protein
MWCEQVIHFLITDCRESEFSRLGCPPMAYRTLAETKIGRLAYSNSPPRGTVVIRILRFFVVLYILFCLLTHIEQNRIVRANYYLKSECNMVALHNARSEKNH